MITEEQYVQSAFDTLIDDVMARVSAVRSTGIAPPPESEWTNEEADRGYRIVADRNPHDPTRLDITVQFSPITLISMLVELSVPE